MLMSSKEFMQAPRVRGPSYGFLWVWCLAEQACSLLPLVSTRRVASIH